MTREQLARFVHDSYLRAYHRLHPNPKGNEQTVPFDELSDLMKTIYLAVSRDLLELFEGPQPVIVGGAPK